RLSMRLRPHVANVSEPDAPHAERQQSEPADGPHEKSEEACEPAHDHDVHVFGNRCRGHVEYHPLTPWRDFRRCPAWPTSCAMSCVAQSPGSPRPLLPACNLPPAAAPSTA